MAQKLIFKIISALVLFLIHLVNVFIHLAYKNTIVHTYSTAYNSKGENPFFFKLTVKFTSLPNVIFFNR